MPVVRAGPQLRLVQPVGDRRVERLVDQRRLARAGDAGDAAEDAERDRRRRSLFRLCWRAPRTTSSPRGSRRCSRDRDLALAGEVLAGERGRVRLDLASACPRRSRGRRARRRPGPRSTRWSAARIVPSSCSTTITVLPRSRSRSSVCDQLRVVALVQADRGLVEDVEHADQARADLGREPDPLRLAAGERARRARQRRGSRPRRCRGRRAAR